MSVEIKDFKNVKAYTEKDFPQLTAQEKIKILTEDLTDLWWILIQALQKSLGKKKGLKIAEEALERYGEDIGEKKIKELMEKGEIKEKNIHAWTVMKARGRSAYEHRWTIIELSEKKAIHILYNCKQVQCYHKWKMPKNTCYLMESVERGMIKAIHPDAKIIPVQRLYRGYNTKGDPVCMSIVEIP
jgi:hypothetical protein